MRAQPRPSSRPPRGHRAQAQLESEWERPGRGCGRSDCPLTRCAANSAALCPWGREEGTGEAFLGLHQRTGVCLRTMTPHPAGCPTLAEDPRCALESLCRRMPRSAPLAGVGLLMAFLSTLRCLVPAPGMATEYLSVLFLADSWDFAVKF